MSCCKVLFSFQAQRCWTWRVQAMMYDLITEHDLLFATQHFLVPELVHLATCIYFSCARFLLYEWVSVEACQAVSRWLEIVFQKKNQSLVDSVSTWQGETISNKSLQPCWALIFILFFLFCFLLVYFLFAEILNIRSHTWAQIWWSLRVHKLKVQNQSWMFTNELTPFTRNFLWSCGLFFFTLFLLLFSNIVLASQKSRLLEFSIQLFPNIGFCINT